MALYRALPSEEKRKLIECVHEFIEKYPLKDAMTQGHRTDENHLCRQACILKLGREDIFTDLNALYCILISLIWMRCHAKPTSTLWRRRSIFHGKQSVIISTCHDPHPNQSYLLLPTDYPGGRIGRPSRAHSRKLCGHITID